MKRFIPFTPVSRKGFVVEECKRGKLTNDREILLSKGRQGIVLTCRAFDFLADDEVLVPASLCSVIYDAFRVANVRLVHYDLTSLFSPDIDDVRRKISPKTKAIYVIHYFGIFTDLAVIHKMCKQHDLKLVEDCALYGNVNRLTCSDVQIFSLWKIFPLLDGALVRFRDVEIAKKVRCTELSRAVAFKPKLLSVVKRGVKSCLSRLAIPVGLIFFLRPKGVEAVSTSAEYEFEFATKIRKISKISEREVSRFSVSNSIEVRRGNFRNLLEFCVESGLRPLFSELQVDDVPYCFPLVVDSAERVSSELRGLGVQTELPVNYLGDSSAKSCSTECSSFLEMMNRQVIGLPVHPGVGANELWYIKTCLMRVMREVDS